MMPPPSPAVTERVNNPECRVAILSLDQLRVWVPQILLVAVDEVIKCGPCLLQRRMSLLAYAVTFLHSLDSVNSDSYLEWSLSEA